MDKEADNRQGRQPRRKAASRRGGPPRQRNGRGKTRDQGSSHAASASIAGLAARQAAAAIYGLVLRNGASLETLCATPGGHAAYLALPAADRALARAIAATALRQRGPVRAALSRLLERPLPARAFSLANVLETAAAQILFLSVPDSAVVNLAVSAIRADPATARFAGLANALLRRVSERKEELLALPVRGQDCFAPWLAASIRRDYGAARMEAIAAAIRREPPVDLTPHPRLGPDEVAALAQRLDASILPTGSLRIAGGRDIASLPGFSDGEWWVQDAAAALPVRLLGDVRGLRVADLCAAPGGKTAQLAAAGALVTALDVSSARMERLRSNLERLRLEAETVVADLLDWRPAEPFDAILLDAPCTATGTMRRHPDIAWNRNEADAAAMRSLQERMIAAAAGMLKPGGRLVYANCSILKLEGEDLLANLPSICANLRLVHPDATVLGAAARFLNRQGAIRTLPCDWTQATQLPGAEELEGGIDGFFACVLEQIVKV